MRQQRGILICIEGIDGSGKSTLAKKLADSLQQNGFDVILTKEPGGSKLGKQLRSILQDRPTPITPVAEYLLFAADRAQHMHDLVKPALEKGMIVISDRMSDSSIVYQGYGRGVDKNMIRTVNEWALQGILPDLTLYVTIDAVTAAERMNQRSRLTAFEQEQKAFVQRLIAGFNELYRNKKNVITIDGSLPIEQVSTKAEKAVNAWLTQQQ